ncbi:MAG: nucleotidyltransferase family protein [Firmicutes bacterium]|nr:nucleotidyltransferase family protein [Bacillota bacterium]
MLFTLLSIAQEFNKENITWALGGSSVLKKYDLVDTVNDIDILVMQKDIEKANQILLSLGTSLPVPKNSQYLTTFFYSYKIREIKVDLMCDFKIKRGEQIYSYQFDESSICDTEDIAKEKIYYTTLEDWYVLYLLMGRGDEQKIKNLEKHFELHGIKHPILLRRAMEDLPSDLKFKIKFQLKP